MKIKCFGWLVLFVSGVFGNNVHEMKVGEPFSWKNCNTTTVPFAFRALSVSPNPIQFGKPVKISFDLVVSQDIGTTNTLKADIDLFMVYEGQEYNMCDYGPKYCHYADVCTAITPLQNYCPSQAKQRGINCQCPFKQNDYKIDNMVIPVPNPPVTVEGTFHGTIHLSESGKEVGCLDLQFCLGSCT